MKFLLLISLLILSVGVKAEITADIIRCSTIATGSDRLDCFDSVAAYYKASTNNTVPVAPLQLNSTVIPQERVDTSQITLSKEDAFGKTAEQINELDSLKSNIVGNFKGWVKGATIRLSNGQQWEVTSRSSGYVNLQNPKVEIWRSFLGSFKMKVEGLNARAKVKRIN